MADNKSRESPVVENQPEKVKSSAKPAKSSSSKTVPTKPSRDDEIVSILQQIRAEQKESSRRQDDFEKKLGEMARDMEYVSQPYEEYEDYGEFDCDPCEDINNNNGKRKCQDEHEKIVSDSRFAGMAKRFKTVEMCDSEIEPVLAGNINELFLKGMNEEQYQELIKDETHPRPSNCEGLVTVKLNQLVWDIVTPNARSKDRKLQNIETSCVKSACILAKTVDAMAKVDAPGIEGINDAIALLGHTNRQINMLRRDLLKPELKNEYSHLCTHSLPYTTQLFGDDVSKTAKDIEDCAKMGYKLQHSRGAYGYSNYSRPRGGRARGRGIMRGFRGRGSSDFPGPSYQPSKNFRRGVGSKRM